MPCRESIPTNFGARQIPKNPHKSVGIAVRVRARSLSYSILPTRTLVFHMDAKLPPNQELSTSECNPDSHSENSDRNRSTVLVLIFVLALSIRFVNLACLSHQPFFDYKIGDAARYDAWASEIAGGNWIGDSVFYQAPLYPYFLAVIYATVGDHVFVVKFIQALLASISCCLLAAACWNFFNRQVGVIAGVIMSLYAPSIFLESLIQKSVLDLVFLCAILWIVSWLLRRPSYRLWLFLGACIGGLCLTRENALALIPLFGIWSLSFGIWRQPSRDKQIPDSEPDRTSGAGGVTKFNFVFRAAVFSFGLMLVLGPVALRNYFIGGEFHITTSQFGPNFYIGNNPNADGYYRPLVFGRGNAKYEQADAIAIAEAAEGRELTAGEVSAYFQNQSFEFIKNDPVGWLKLLGAKTLLSINATEIIDTEDQYVYEQYAPFTSVLSRLFHFGMLFPLTMVGLWVTRRRWKQLWVLYGMLALFQLTLIAFFVFGRYRFPVVPVCICFAAPVVYDLWMFATKWVYERDSKAKTLFLKKYPVWLCCIWLVIAVLTLVPLVSRKAQSSATYNNFAVQSLIRSDWDQAEKYIELSLAAQNDYALAHNSKGVLHRERGEWMRAKLHFQLAVENEPEYATAKQNLEKLTKVSLPSDD